MGRTVGYQGLRGLTGVVALATTLALPAATGVFAAEGNLYGDALLDVPSGQQITFHEAIYGEESTRGPAVRFRFLAPSIARSKNMIGFPEAEEDMAVLCQDYVLPVLAAEQMQQPSQIIIVLSDRPVVHGTTDPEATQFFEAYRPEDGLCIWEGF